MSRKGIHSQKNRKKGSYVCYPNYNVINKKVLNCAADNWAKYLIISVTKLNITIKPNLWKYFNMVNIKMHIILIIASYSVMYTVILWGLFLLLMVKICISHSERHFRNIKNIPSSGHFLPLLNILSKGKQYLHKNIYDSIIYTNEKGISI